MIYNYILRGTSAMHRAATKLSIKALERKASAVQRFGQGIDSTHEMLIEAANKVRQAQRDKHSKMISNVAVEAAKCQQAQVSAVQR